MFVINERDFGRLIILCKMVSYNGLQLEYKNSVYNNVAYVITIYALCAYLYVCAGLH